MFSFPRCVLCCLSRSLIIKSLFYLKTTPNQCDQKDIFRTNRYGMRWVSQPPHQEPWECQNLLGRVSKADPCGSASQTLSISRSGSPRHFVNRLPRFLRITESELCTGCHGSPERVRGLCGGKRTARTEQQTPGRALTVGQRGSKAHSGSLVCGWRGAGTLGRRGRWGQNEKATWELAGKSWTSFYMDQDGPA